MIVTTYYDHLQRNRRQTIMILYVYHVLLQTYVAGRCLKTTHPRKRQLKRFCIYNVLCYFHYQTRGKRYKYAYTN